MTMSKEDDDQSYVEGKATAAAHCMSSKRKHDEDSLAMVQSSKRVKPTSTAAASASANIDAKADGEQKKCWVCEEWRSSEMFRKGHKQCKSCLKEKVKERAAKLKGE